MGLSAIHYGYLKTKKCHFNMCKCFYSGIINLSLSSRHWDSCTNQNLLQFAKSCQTIAKLDKNFKFPIIFFTPFCFKMPHSAHYTCHYMPNAHAVVVLLHYPFPTAKNGVFCFHPFSTQREKKDSQKCLMNCVHFSSLVVWWVGWVAGCCWVDSV